MREQHTPSIPLQHDEPTDGKYAYFSSAFESGLNLLRDVARLAPFSYLWEASQVALAIWTTVETTKQNKEAFIEIAWNAYELVCVIVNAVSVERAKERLDERIKSHFKELYITLCEIKKMMDDDARRTYVKRFLRHPYDLNKIKKYRRKLKQSLRVFGLKSTISMSENLFLIRELQEQILAQQRAESSRPQLIVGSTAATPPDAASVASRSQAACQARATSESIYASPSTDIQPHHTAIPQGATSHTTSPSEGPAPDSQQPSSPSVSSPAQPSQSPPTNGPHPTSRSHRAELSLPDSIPVSPGSIVSHRTVHGNFTETNNSRNISNFNSGNITNAGGTVNSYGNGNYAGDGDILFGYKKLSTPR